MRFSSFVEVKSWKDAERTAFYEWNTHRKQQWEMVQTKNWDNAWVTNTNVTCSPIAVGPFKEVLGVGTPQPRQKYTPGHQLKPGEVLQVGTHWTTEWKHGVELRSVFYKPDGCIHLRVIADYEMLQEMMNFDWVLGYIPQIPEYGVESWTRKIESLAEASPHFVTSH